LEDQFSTVYVEGEISNFARPSSGHWYFTLKDRNAQVRCAMFRNRNQGLKLRPADGMQVIARARVSLYEGRGEFQLIVDNLEEAGDGALRRAYEALKANLQTEGLFDVDQKKAIPALPKHLGIITSPTGAAIHDVLTVLSRRFPGIPVSIIPVQVQGEESPAQIVRALEFANSYEANPFDVLLLTRGGGSLEDLWSFNVEAVARAVFASQVPIVSAIGHESDVSITDFVADLRAPTPSAAAELLSPSQAAWSAEFDRQEQRLGQLISHKLVHADQAVIHLSHRLRKPGDRLQMLMQRMDELEIRLQRSASRLFTDSSLGSFRQRLQLAMENRLNRVQQDVSLLQAKLKNPEDRLRQINNRIDACKISLGGQMQRLLTERKAALSAEAARLNTLSPLSTLERGYAIVTNSHGDHVITSATSLAAGQQIRGRLRQGGFVAEIKEVIEPTEGKDNHDD